MLYQDSKKNISPNTIITDLANPELSIKNEAIRNIPQILSALGPERIKKEFIPYLLSKYIPFIITFTM